MAHSAQLGFRTVKRCHSDAAIIQVTGIALLYAGLLGRQVGVDHVAQLSWQVEERGGSIARAGGVWFHDFKSSARGEQVRVRA